MKTYYNDDQPPAASETCRHGTRSYGIDSVTCRDCGSDITPPAASPCKAADDFICEWLDCPVHGDKTAASDEEMARETLTVTTDCDAYRWCDDECRTNPSNACGSCAHEHRWRARLTRVRAEATEAERERLRKLVYASTVSHGDHRVVYCSDCQQTWQHRGEEVHDESCVLADHIWGPRQCPPQPAKGE